MFQKQTPQVSRSNSQSSGKNFYSAVLQSTLTDQTQGS